MGAPGRRARPPRAGRARADLPDHQEPRGHRRRSTAAPINVVPAILPGWPRRQGFARLGAGEAPETFPDGCRCRPSGGPAAVGADQASASPARAPRAGAQPGGHDRPRHQHLPDRQRRDRSDRSRAPTTRSHLDAVAGRGRRPHPVDPRDPHPPRPLARRRRPQGAHRRRGARLRRARRLRARHVHRRRTPRGRARVPPAGRPHARPRVQPPLLRPRGRAPAVLRRPHHERLDGRHRSPPDGDMAAYLEALERVRGIAR